MDQRPASTGVVKHPAAGEHPPGEASRIMKELGFSDNETSLYLQLLGKPEAEPIESAISHSVKNEDAIRNLVEKGLVRIVSNRLEAVEPKLFIQKLQDSRRVELSQSFEQLAARASRLLSILEPQYWESRLGIKPEELLEPLPNLGEMEVRTVRTIAHATKNIRIVAETFRWFDKVAEEIYQARERGVGLRLLLMATDSETMRRASELKRSGAEVRQLKEDWYPVRGTLCDDTELVFLIWASRESESQRPKYFRPHYTRNPGMIRVFADAFERWWTEAKPL